MNRNSDLRIIVTGFIAQHPSLGGVTWDYLQHMLVPAGLGNDIFYFEDSGEWPHNEDSGTTGNDWIARDPSRNVGHLAMVMERFGLGDRWAYHFPIQPQWFGLPTRKRKEVLESADLLINISGCLERPADYRRIPRLVYIDSDSVFTQVKLQLPKGHDSFRKRLEIHDLLFSFGESLPGTGNGAGYHWKATRQPIVLSEWRPSAAPRHAYTTVMSWTSYKPLKFNSQTYGQKDLEFQRFIELPARLPAVWLEVALGKITHNLWESEYDNLPPAVRDSMRSPTRWTPKQLLTHIGWRVVDSDRCVVISTATGTMSSHRGPNRVCKKRPRSPRRPLSATQNHAINP